MERNIVIHLLWSIGIRRYVSETSIHLSKTQTHLLRTPKTNRKPRIFKDFPCFCLRENGCLPYNLPFTDFLFSIFYFSIHLLTHICGKVIISSNNKAVQKSKVYLFDVYDKTQAVEDGAIRPVCYKIASSAWNWTGIQSRGPVKPTACWDRNWYTDHREKRKRCLLGLKKNETWLLSFNRCVGICNPPQNELRLSADWQADDRNLHPLCSDGDLSERLKMCWHGVINRYEQAISKEEYTVAGVVYAGCSLCRASCGWAVVY